MYARPQRSALLELFSVDQGTLVLARLDLCALARLHARACQWLKDTGWVPGRTRAFSSVQRKNLCDRTPFTFKKHLTSALDAGPAWLVTAFVRELEA